MECIEAAELSEKYEVGELSGYRKKKFEHHLKECKKCNEKYGSILLLGAIMGSSAKSADLPLSNGYSIILKGKTAISFALIVATGITAALFMGKPDLKREESVKYETVMPTEQTEDSFNSKVKTAETSGIEMKRNLKIISKSEEKEVEITVDKKSLKKNNRCEK